MTPPKCKVCGRMHWGPCYVPAAPKVKATRNPKAKNGRPQKRSA